MTTVLFNTSVHRRTQWVTVAVPQTDSRFRPGEALLFGGFYAVVGPAVGRRTRLVFVRATLDGRASAELYGAQPCDKVPLKVDRRLIDQPHFLKVRAEDATTGLEIAELDMFSGFQPSESHFGDDFIEVVSRVSKGGFHGLLALRLFGDSGDFEMDLSVTWSDRNDPRNRLPAGVLTVASDTALAVCFGSDRGMTTDPTSREGERTAVCIGWEWWPDSTSWRMTARGCVITDEATRMEAYIRSDGAIMACDTSLAVDGLCDIEGVPELPTISTAEIGNQAVARSTRRATSWPKDMFGVRLMASAPQVYWTGSQWPFGIVKDLQSTVDPMRLYELLHYSADDYLMRGCHFREADGSRVTVANHPNWDTFNLLTDSVSRDKLGKSGPRETGWSWCHNDTLRGRCVEIDDEHRGDLGLFFAYSVSKSPILRECILDMLECDKARAYPRRGWIGTLEAPRATGRCWISWASMISLLDSPTAIQDAIDCAALELTAREAADAELEARGEVPWMWRVRSSNYNPNAEMAIPWHEAIAVLGAVAMVHALKMSWSGPSLSSPAPGHAPTPANVALLDRFRAWAKKHTAKLLRYGVAVDRQNHVAWPVSAIRTGAPPTQQALTMPLPTTAGDHDVIVAPDQTWWTWWSGVVLVHWDRWNGGMRPQGVEEENYRMIVQALGQLPKDEAWMSWCAPLADLLNF